MIYTCACGAPATHMVLVTVEAADVTVPATREPDLDSDVRYGTFSAGHVPTLAHLKRSYMEIGLDITSYEIRELTG